MQEAPFFWAGPGLEPARPWCSLTEAPWHWSSARKGWSLSFKWLLVSPCPERSQNQCGGGWVLARARVS